MQARRSWAAAILRRECSCRWQQSGVTSQVRRVCVSYRSPAASSCTQTRLGLCVFVRLPRVLSLQGREEGLTLLVGTCSSSSRSATAWHDWLLRCSWVSPILCGRPTHLTARSPLRAALTLRPCTCCRNPHNHHPAVLTQSWPAARGRRLPAAAADAVCWAAARAGTTVRDSSCCCCANRPTHLPSLGCPRSTDAPARWIAAAERSAGEEVEAAVAARLHTPAPSRALCRRPGAAAVRFHGGSVCVDMWEADEQLATYGATTCDGQTCVE